MGKLPLLCKWSLSILIELYKSPKRPSDLKRCIKGISERVLFDRLKKLHSLGILAKKSNHSYPLVTIYFLKEREKYKNLVKLIEESQIDQMIFLSLLTCKWSLSIMTTVNTPKTLKEIKQSIKEISDKILFQRLNMMLENHIIDRIIYADKKPVV